MNVIARSDTRLFYWLFSFTARRDCQVIKLISKSGDGYIYLLLGAVLACFEAQYGQLFLLSAIFAYAMELPLYVVLKQLLKRTRPCDFIRDLRAHVTPSDKFSLPSGHTAAAFLMAAQIAHFYPKMTIVVYVWACAIGLSRVLLGVHYPSDILAGAALGITVSFVSFYLTASV